jgi:pyruvate/oxaloacetate carboxyltransferase
MGEAREKVAPTYKGLRQPHQMSRIDTGVLVHQVPGGMISTMTSARYDIARTELVRKQRGLPPAPAPPAPQ